MKPFSLDTVLRHRKSLENQAIHRLAKAREDEQEARRHLQTEEKILATLLETLAQEQTMGIEVVKLAQFERRIILIDQQILTLRTVLQRKQEAVNQAHKYLIAKSKERKIMETLQQNQNEAWHRYLNQKETAALDEVAVIFHNRE
jgi:flagellar protein FliJ